MDTPASIACRISAASRNSRTFAARSHVVQYRHSSGCFVFVSTSNRSRRSCSSASPFICVA
jgi:hypothetical protein